MAREKTRASKPPKAGRNSNYAPAFALFLAGALLFAWPWLSGAFTIPWDAKAHFYPQLVFLARSLHAGQSPFWTPNIFGGHPQIADPQSLIFSPPHFLLALFDRAPSFMAFDAIAFAMLALGGLSLMMLFRDLGGLAAATHRADPQPVVVRHRALAVAARDGSSFKTLGRSCGPCRRLYADWARSGGVAVRVCARHHRNWPHS
jgi:hypothetical protein